MNSIVVSNENAHQFHQEQKKLPVAASSVDLASGGHPGDLSIVSCHG
jgi:hypothetical protein